MLQLSSSFVTRCAVTGGYCQRDSGFQRYFAAITRHTGREIEKAVETPWQVRPKDIGRRGTESGTESIEFSTKMVDNSEIQQAESDGFH